MWFELKIQFPRSLAPTKFYAISQDSITIIIKYYTIFIHRGIGLRTAVGKTGALKEQFEQFSLCGLFSSRANWKGKD